MNALVKSDGNLGMLGNLAARYEMDPAEFRNTIARTCMPPNATNEEFVAFLMVCNTYTLNPILREIYAFPKKGGGIVPIVSIDGWIRLVNQHPNFEGAEWEAHFGPDEKLYAYTCKIFRNDRKMPIVMTEYLSECFRQTEPWRMTHRMLRHKAFIQCARYAFGFSGVYDEDEGHDISGSAGTDGRRSRSTPRPPSEGGGGVIDAEARDVTGQPEKVKEAEPEKKPEPEKSAPKPATKETPKPAEPEKKAETKPEPEKANPAETKADADEGGFPGDKKPKHSAEIAALIAKASVVVEDGVVTKNDEGDVGGEADEDALKLADLILTKGKITKNVVKVRADKRFIAKLEKIFDFCDSMDSLDAAANANADAYDELADKAPATALYNAAKARIEAAAAAQGGGEQQQAGETEGTQDGPQESGEQQEDIHGAGEDDDEGDLRDPATMSWAEYDAYARAYIDAATDKELLKKIWFGESAIRTALEKAGAPKKETDALKVYRTEKLNQLAGIA